MSRDPRHPAQEWSIQQHVSLLSEQARLISPKTVRILLPSKSTSPTNCLFFIIALSVHDFDIPTSMTVAPSLTIRCVTSSREGEKKWSARSTPSDQKYWLARPTADTITSAFLQYHVKLFTCVSRWHIVTVAPLISWFWPWLLDWLSIRASGVPTYFERPMTTISLPCRGWPTSSSSSLTAPTTGIVMGGTDACR